MTGEETSEFIIQTLRGLNLKLHAVKEVSAKLLPYTDEEHYPLLLNAWEKVFREKIASEKVCLGLFFVIHELLYRVTENGKFRDSAFNKISACIVLTAEQGELEKFQMEIAKLIKLWNDHKIFDIQSIIRLTTKLNLKTQIKEELVKGLLPTGLANPPQELVQFASNVQDLQNYQNNSRNNQLRLQELENIVIEQSSGQAKENVSALFVHQEITTHTNQLQNNLQMENKAREQTLKSYKEVLNIVDKLHMKAVIQLKLSLQRIEKLQQLADEGDIAKTNNP